MNLAQYLDPTALSKNTRRTFGCDSDFLKALFTPGMACMQALQELMPVKSISCTIFHDSMKGFELNNVFQRLC